MPLVEIHQPAQPQFEGRTAGADAHRAFGRNEIKIGHEKACLDARHVECARTDGAYAAALSGAHQCIPELVGLQRISPQFVAQIASEARARDHQAHARSFEESKFEGFQALDSRETELLQHRARGRSLERERRDLLSHFADLHVEANGGIQEPVELTFCSAQPVLGLAQPEHGAVIDDVTGVVAPDAVADAIDAQLAEVACHQPVEVATGIGAGNAVLDHRRQVVDRAGIANGEIFLAGIGEHIDRGVAGPWDEAVDLAERALTLVEWRGKQRLPVVRRQAGGVVH